MALAGGGEKHKYEIGAELHSVLYNKGLYSEGKKTLPEPYPTSGKDIFLDSCPSSLPVWYKERKKVKKHLWR